MPSGVGSTRYESASGAVPVAEMGLDLGRQVAAGEDRAVDAVAGKMLEGVREERPVDERQHGLRRARGQRTQARALAPDEDDRREADAELTRARCGRASDARRR